MLLPWVSVLAISLGRLQKGGRDREEDVGGVIWKHREGSGGGKREEGLKQAATGAEAADVRMGKYSLVRQWKSTGTQMCECVI